MAHVGSNQQPLDSKTDALPTALPRKIYEVGFKQLLHVQRYSIATVLHVTAEPRGRPVASSIVLLKQKILPFMKLGELSVNIYYYTLNNIFYIK